MADERRLEERGLHPRVLAVCMPFEWIWTDRQPNAARSVVDISTGGARMIMNRAFRAGESVAVRLDGIRSKRSITLSADVRWVEPLPSVSGTSQSFVAGLRFRRAPGLLELLLAT